MIAEYSNVLPASHRSWGIIQWIKVISIVLPNNAICQGLIMAALLTHKRGIRLGRVFKLVYHFVVFARHIKPLSVTLLIGASKKNHHCLLREELTKGKNFDDFLVVEMPSKMNAPPPTSILAGVCNLLTRSCFRGCLLDTFGLMCCVGVEVMHLGDWNQWCRCWFGGKVEKTPRRKTCHIDGLTDWHRDKIAAISRRYFQIHFFNQHVSISIKVSPKFVPKGPNNTIPTLVQIMVWHRPGDKPLSEPMMVILLTYMRNSVSMSQSKRNVTPVR